MRSRSGTLDVRDLPSRDSLLAELDASADAVTGRAPYPIAPGEMVDTIAAFEAITRSIATGQAVRASEL